MEKQTITDLLTDLERSVRRCRIEYSKETTERIEADIASDKKANTIRLLRRQVRRLKSLLKSKDRLLKSQKSFYEEMLNEVQKKQKKSDQDIEKWFSEMVLKTIKQLK